MGDDVYACDGGRWKELLTCPYGCTEDPVLEPNPKKNWVPSEEANLNVIGRPDNVYKTEKQYFFKNRRVDHAETQNVGHCKCEVNYPDICVGDDRYKCLGYKDQRFYTRIERCAGGCSSGQCLPGILRCDEDQKRACCAGTMWVCKDSFWIRDVARDETCSIAALPCEIRGAERFPRNIEGVGEND